MSCIDEEQEEQISQEVQANAQLIALAPTLYEQHFKMLDALKRALPYVTGAYECAFPDEQENIEIKQLIEQTIKECEL